MTEGIIAPSFTVVSGTELTVAIGTTVTARVAVDVAHCPAAVVNVYTPEAWLSITEGLHVPVMPLEETAGNVGAALPEQSVNADPKSNVGVATWLTVTENVCVLIH